ncbi:cellulase family glycosylhydrolase [Flavobacterium nackdongense]|uniref:Glycoside hydrolase family 5 protein n=1 Tax=Flavobacterium nackdongense TaxID=2547394 RepID=A0A4P6YIL0_9FLAO|nr:cellulase family glycosylhydrolase [Flavobacterium nackdongense]QBN20440.1 glycoside hydrolase family 5 protein [Flavobacterium nackdongense]
MKSKSIILLVVLHHLSILSLQAQITPNAMVAKMGRGINLGNVLSAPIEGNWAPPVQESYFDNIALVGFKTVRIPIRFDSYTTPFSSVTYKDANGNYIGNVSDYTVSTAYLNRIEQVVDWALAKGLIPIIDVHGDHWFWESYRATIGGQPNPDYKTGADRLAAEDRFRAIWTAISTRFQNKSENLLFEIMNEAYFSMNEAEVDNTNTYILNIIRATNPTRNVIVNGGKKNSYESPLQMGVSYPNNNNYLYNDKYLIATFHYYLPRAFTASADATNNDNDWGTVQDKLDVDAHFNLVKNWSQTVGVPVFLGEFGADNEGGFNYSTGQYGANGGPDPASRAEFHRYLAQKAIDLGFSFAVWDAGDESGKTIYKVTNKDWVVDVRNAVLNAQCSSSGIIDNADLECNYDFVWGLTTQNGAVASRNNALTAESYNNSKTIKINVATAGTNPESVILNNKTATTGFTIGANYSFRCFAKGNNNQTFNIRIKAVINGVEAYQTSPNLTLTNAYQEFAFPYTVQPNTTSLEFQLLSGLNAGDYYFDNFSATTVLNGNYYYDGSGSVADTINWWSNTDGTGVNPSNFTADAQIFILRNTTAVTTTASWTVSGAGSKIVVGDSSQPGLSLTVANTFPITGTIDIAAASSGVNSLVWQSTILPTFGTLDSTSEVHFQLASGTNYAFVTSPSFGKLFIDGSGSVSFSSTTIPVVVLTSLTVASGSILNLAFATANYVYLTAGATAVINGTVKSPKLAGIFSFGVGTADLAKGSIQFFDANPNLILGAASTIEYSRSTASGTSTQIISTLPTTVSYANLTFSEVPSAGSTTKTINGPIVVTNKLTVSQSTNAGSTFTTGGFLTLKSTATQTAVVSPVVGTITGNVIVERYIPSGFRAYRLLSSPVTTSTSVQANWQENSLNANPNPGYGTHITGVGGNTNGFDATTSNAPSLFTHNNTGAPASWTAMTTTTGTLAAGLPYLIYIRGSRQATNISTLGNDATTLRATGVLKTGTVAVTNLNATANGFSAIGNPYQAQVDMQAVLSTSTNLNTSFYYVLEPKMGSKGQYVTVNVVTNTNTGGSTANRYLQPWQGAFVKTVAVPTATPTLSFTENNKYEGTPQTSVFKTANTSSSLRLALYETASLAQNGYPLDGLIVDFGASESNEVNQNDAVKLTNFDENMATSNSGKLLSIERRAIPIEADQIPLSINNYKGTNYTLKIDASALTGANPYLQDSYTNTTTEIPQEGNLNYNFTVDAGIPASVASDRFKIVYAKTLGIDQPNFDSNSIVVYKDKGVFYVNSGAEVLDSITIFDIQGKKIGQHKNINSKSYRFNAAGISPQVLIFKISTAEGKVVSKKVVN